MSETSGPPAAPKSRWELWFEGGLFAARWLMAPVYAGLVLALGAVLVVFLKDLWTALSHLLAMKPDDAIMMALSLIDLSLAGNLLLMVIYSGYENFIGRIDTVHEADRPGWMGTIDFSGLKMKLIASIVAISAVALLRAFMKIEEDGVDASRLTWMIALHLTFVISGVMLALMDWLNSRSESP